ncbi:MAG: hypothetical protein QNJ47_22370 [Nostocaceae cyanobacterium]|nr:hypothetical protein [Nostocaceae cyanobacterium]
MTNLYQMNILILIRRLLLLHPPHPPRYQSKVIDALRFDVDSDSERKAIQSVKSRQHQPKYNV